MTPRSRTNTGRCREVGFVSDVTVAAERSDGVDALAVPTQIRHHLAFVDVCQNGDIFICLSESFRDDSELRPFCLISSPRPSVVYPGPSGHIFLYCTVPGRGQSSHCGPQPRPTLQQHSDFVTLFLLVEDCWHMVRRTSV